MLSSGKSSVRSGQLTGDDLAAAFGVWPLSGTPSETFFSLESASVILCCFQ